LGRTGRVFNKHRARESLTNHRFKPKPNKAKFKQRPNKARFKPKPNKSQTGYRIRGESFNTGLEARVDDLPTVSSLLVNPDLELHDVPNSPQDRRLED